MNLRPYQQEFAARIAERFKSGGKYLGCLPTGTGKTQVFASIPQIVNLPPRRKMLVLVHRDELASQSARKLTSLNPGRSVAIEKADLYAPDDADLIVASIQTLSRGNKVVDGQYTFSKRISRFDPGQFDVVVVDEAHHVTAETWKSCLAYFGVLKGTPNEDPRKFLLGVTATPRRTDNIGLENIFDEIIYPSDTSRPQLLDFIQDGWLVPIKSHRVDTMIDLSKIHRVQGDLDKKELAAAVDTPERNRLVVDKYVEHGEGLSAICFAVNVEHAMHLTDAFNAANIPAMYVTGKTAPEERKRLLRLHQEGYFKVFVNVGIAVEGYDDPRATVALMARPSESGTFFTQAIGRVLRPFPAQEDIAAMTYRGETPSWIKPYAIVVDFCDLSTKHSLLNLPTLFGMKPSASLGGKKINEVVKELTDTIEQKKLPIRLDEVDSMDTLKGISVRINLLAPPKVPDQVRRISRYSWIELSQGGYGLSLPDRTVVRVTEDTLGRYEIAKSINGIKTVVGTANTLEDAIARADGMVPKDAEVLMNGASGWRKKPVSDAQLRMIWRMDFKAQRHFNKDYDEFVRHARQKYPTSGIASDKINELQNTYKPPPWMAKWQAKKEAERQHAH